MQVSNILLFGPKGAINTPTPKEGDPHTFGRADPNFEAISGDAVFAMTFNADADPDELPELAREECGSKPFGKVLGWTDPKRAARGFPLTDRESQLLALSYSLNRSTGCGQVLWDCKRWKRTGAEECMAGNEPPAEQAQKAGS